MHNRVCINYQGFHMCIVHPRWMRCEYVGKRCGSDMNVYMTHIMLVTTRIPLPGLKSYASGPGSEDDQSRGYISRSLKLLVRDLDIQSFKKCGCVTHQSYLLNDMRWFATYSVDMSYALLDKRCTVYVCHVWHGYDIRLVPLNGCVIVLGL